MNNEENKLENKQTGSQDINNSQQMEFNKTEVIDLDDISRLSKETLDIKVKEVMKECFSDPKVLKSYRKRRTNSTIILIVFALSLIAALTVLILLVYFYSKR
ncbi:hypothetical protein ACJA25_00630 [Mycoplasmopsis hyopharyngis]|uniref:hypothetical protein n=1 Tax=Mycoplasmopsis hyopharyngis TaxID=29558 RepID=UPI003873CA3A